MPNFSVYLTLERKHSSKNTKIEKHLKLYKINNLPCENRNLGPDIKPMICRQDPGWASVVHYDRGLSFAKKNTQIYKIPTKYKKLKKSEACS